MRAVVNTDDGIRTIEVNEPGGAGVRLSVAAAGICGTDVQLAGIGMAGFVYGHEFAGVDETGTPHFVEPTIHGGECGECRGGNPRRCTEPGHGNLGVFSDGGMAEAVVVPEYTLLALPPALDVKDACLIEPGAVAWHAVRRAQVRPGERVLVVGAGTIGLLAAAAAQDRGLHVDVDTRYDHQQAAAEQLGFGEPSDDYDVVIDAAGSDSSLARAADAARRGGRIVPLGVYMDTMPIPGTAVSQVKELTYVNSIAYGRHDGVREVEEVAAMLARKPGIAKTLITHRFPIEDAGEAFRVAADRAAGSIKVVIEP
ncbi:NAD(P)-dependent sugar dehydrogenase [Kibdelosporangium phytohabitans]|uniref:Molecular chaperone GroES n=1 Tax=Kibdelosporangium phytohabitans TaxID=860235 RepID=A0A0N9IES0_9PSEU|nr:NAD(P)-dependent sugar dehydrogenase [Kibdelosporangium phytohabitans]ALG15040.1 molecular chaperone GroES [Kibdelosporangium phytohabitans]MBE1468935.1 2-desacetyl-2-hydroxyethyl bacteriochlorophyllide A dehydrogenase [Kibdelosporangium phytohabitans]